MQESHESRLLAAILENLTGGFIAIDEERRIMILNPAARRILELPEGLNLDLPVEQALIGAPDFAKILLDTLATRSPIKRHEINWLHGNRRRLIGYGTMVLKDSQSRLMGVAITFQDITPLGF
jgi:PAS domain-containing protein